MPALELIGGQATQPSTTFTALTMNAGNSNTVRNTNSDVNPILLNAWTDCQAGGNLRIRSPRLHDNVQGIRLVSIIGEPWPLLPFGRSQNLISQDTLTLEITGSNTAGDIECAGFLIYYPELPGVNARFIDADELNTRGVNIMGQENTLATGTAGGWSGQEAINAEFDNFKANTDYALVGYLTSAECCSIRWQGADSGNLGVGGPGNIAPQMGTADWFRKLSDFYKLPLIPVFNSANKNAILIDAHQDENGADPTVTSIFVELAP